MRSDQRVSADDVGAELAAWRRKHGGRGKPIPPRFWALAIELAARNGVEETALALCLDKRRLARRAQGAAGVTSNASEVLPPAGQATLEVLGRDGERLRLHLMSATTEQLVALVRAFAKGAP